MHPFNLSRKTIILLLLTVAISSCSKSTESPAGADLSESLLQFVPADSPYVIAQTTPFPDEVLDQLEPLVDEFLRAQAAVIRAVVEENLEAKVSQGADEGEIAKFDALADEVGSLMTLDGVRAAGIGRQSTSVVYGQGLLPVLRLALTDGKLMEQTIARIEDKAGSKMSVGKIGAQSYRYAGDDDAKIILAIVDDDLVVSLVQATHSDALLESVLGLTKPAKSMADSGELQALMKEYSLAPYSLLLVNGTRIAATFLDDQTGINKELLALMEYDAATISDLCKTEIRALAGIAPRLAGGYTEINTERWTSVFLVEFRDDIAKGLATLTAPVPGLGNSEAGLFSFGMSLDVLAARAFYEERLDGMEQDPFQCEYFADLQGSVAQGREALKQPVPPIAYSVNGFLASVDAIDGMDMANQQPPTSVDGRFLLSTNNPQGLLAMGAMFSAELAALDLQPDGKPVKLELPPISPLLSEAFVAMTDNALALSLGNDQTDKLVKMLDADFADPAPFISLFMDTGRYYELVAKTIQLEKSDKASPELLAAISDMMTSMADWFGKATFDVNFTARGMEVLSTIEIAEDE